jgi:hypothetical protein
MEVPVAIEKGLQRVYRHRVSHHVRYDRAEEVSMPKSIFGLSYSDFRWEPSSAALRSFAEAATWCFRRPSGDNPFRSLELDPSSILDISSLPHDRISIEEWIDKKRDSYRRAVSWIIETRSELLKKTGIGISDSDDVLAKSKLLLYEPLETVSDGAAEAASLNFYDVKDAPPWDTWFWYAGTAIFCCVSESDISAA